MGCQLTPQADAHLRQQGALVFPPVSGLPFDPYRDGLYTAPELYEGLERGYANTRDAHIHAWSRSPRAQTDALHLVLRGLHDDAVSNGLEQLLRGGGVVGVMGGHGVDRGGHAYRRAAEVGKAISRAGLVVLTGGGPGSMEAAHLGAYLAPFPRTAVDEALALLARTRHFEPDATLWAQPPFAVRERFPEVDAGVSVGIPTWSYGAQPPAAFATHIGKYFANAIREDGLLDRATAGVVFLPGSTGTVQEIFQNAAQNSSVRHPSTPMIFLDENFWTSELPVWPLLERLATRHGFSDLVWLVDTVDDVVRILEDSRPRVGHPFAHAQAKMR